MRHRQHSSLFHCLRRPHLILLLVIVQLTMIPTKIVKATAVIVEVGNNDPGSCDTLGQHIRMPEYCCSGAVTFYPHFAIAGVTKSKAMVTGSATPTDCLSKAYAFFQFYEQSTDNAVVLKNTQVYNDVMTINSEAVYFGSVVAMQFKYHHINDLNSGFFVMIMKL